jgi:hypothetical protein
MNQGCKKPTRPIKPGWFFLGKTHFKKPNKTQLKWFFKLHLKKNVKKIPNS